MKYLKAWNVALWVIFAFDVFALIFAIVAGNALWWVSALAVVLIICALFLHQKTMKHYND